MKIGQILDALGIENVSVQVFNNQPHTELSVDCMETYERLYAYLSDKTQGTPKEISMEVEKIIQKWSRSVKLDPNEKFIVDYREWFSYNNGKRIIEEMKRKKEIFYGNGGE